MHLSTISKVSRVGVFFHVNRRCTFLEVRFSCYIKIMAFCLVELLRNSAKGVPGASVRVHPLNPAR